MAREEYRPSQSNSGSTYIAKIMEATQTVTHLYSLRSSIMPQHNSRYYAMELKEMFERSNTQIFRWATHGNMEFTVE